MRSQTVLLVLLAISTFLIAGCTVQKAFPASRQESVSNVQQYDLDGDSANDLFIYEFTPVSYDNHTVKRQVAIAAHNRATFSSLNNLTDLQLIGMRSHLDNFASDQALSLETCASNAGLKKDCTDATSCLVLCTGSYKCSKVANSFQGAIAGSMVDFVDDRTRMDAELLDVRNSVLGLRAANEEQKNVYLGKVLDVTYYMADMYANPMYNRPELLLCSRSEFGMSALRNTSMEIGNYAPAPVSYDYFVTIWVSGDDQSAAVSSVEISDSIPSWAIAREDDLTSHQQLNVEKNISSYVIGWESERSSPAGSMLVYRFSSDKPPSQVMPQLRSPTLIVNTLDLRVFAMPDALFNAVYGATGSFFIALGAALSLTLVFLLLFYNAVTTGYFVIRSKVSGSSAGAGMRKAFGRLEPRWKSDIIVGIVLLGIGYYLSTSVASDLTAPNSMFGALDYFTGLALSTTAAAGLAGVGCVFLGLLLTYTAIENKVKITILEKAYGAAIKEERMDFSSRVARLKDKMAELQRLLESSSKEEFDVSSEYDVLASISSERIDELAKKATPEARKMIDKDLSEVEAAIERISERKKTADESWVKWSDNIGKMLSEQNEVYVTSLINVPASLRSWALVRYAKEHAAEGVVFEKDTLRRKKVSADALIAGMISAGTIEGAVIVKNDELQAAHVAHGAATVPAALSLKLRSYLRSFARSQGQPEPSSFAAVGDKLVLVVMKEAETESTLFIPREKFKDAIEEWKKKTKTVE